MRRDPSDAYAWQLLVAARFVSGDSLGAIDAWNHDDQPRVDLIRLDGLTRTRYASRSNRHTTTRVAIRPRQQPVTYAAVWNRP